MELHAEIHRKTRETDIKISLNLDGKRDIEINTPLPFFNHMLHAMSFHGGFSLSIDASGDVEVDPHHLVEDTGLVLGQAFKAVAEKAGKIQRYGDSIIPMDDALSEVIVDACNRPYLLYNAAYPQEMAGTFSLSLVREFLLGFTNEARINLHALCRYGENGHHMAEALFKALGRALNQAYRPSDEKLSTKGVL